MIIGQRPKDNPSGLPRSPVVCGVLVFCQSMTTRLKHNPGHIVQRAFATSLVRVMASGAILLGLMMGLDYSQAKAGESSSLFENLAGSQSSGGSALWFIARSQPSEASELSAMVQETETAAVLRWHAEQVEVDSFQALRLGPQKISSLLGYVSRFSVYTGFGEFYQNEPLHLTRNNGAGTENPRWFYLKVSFRL